MIAINVVYAEFDLLCVIIMLMLTVKTITLSKSLKYQWLYLILMAFSVLLVVSDGLYELYAAGAVGMPLSLVYALNIAYFISSILIGYCWFVYTLEICSLEIVETVRNRILLFAPAGILSILACFTYYTRWLFYFDETGYHRGTINIIYMIVPLLYFLSAWGVALRNHLRKHTELSKSQLKTVSAFAAFPLLSVAVQFFFVGFPAVCIGAALGMLQVFLGSIAKDREELIIQETTAKAKNDFFTNMSHEIRTPINAILGMNTMILRESESEDIRGYSRHIENSGKMLMSLVNDILDMSKIEAGKMRLVNVEYDTSAMIRELIMLVDGSMRDKKLVFVNNISADIPKKLYGDEVRIRQIILNILSNAVKYTQKGSVIMTVGGEKISGDKFRLHVSIKDTGRGMRREAIDQLFSPYARFDESSNRKIEGTGLGMTITKQLLALMDSKLDVESEVGLGSDFSFSIVQPIVDATPIGHWDAVMQQKATPDKYKPAFRAPAARLLAVDDTTTNLKVFKALLKKTEVNIDTAVSGEEALEMVRSNRYDMVFLDIMMPKLDGIATLRMMHDEDNTVTDDTPIIALTANAYTGARDEYRGHGFADYLSKPIEFRALENLIINYLPKDKLESIQE